MWYSKKTKKEDGLALGTIITIFRDPSANWGTLDGSLSSRYPGYIECDGRTLSKLDYPDLFDIIGYQYGGSGNNFKIPNYRNRVMMGTGRVDGNVASSPALPTKFGPDTSSGAVGDANTAGSSGGDWYIKDVDASGPPPLEQVYTGSTPPDGPFFKIGTLSTTGYSSTTGSVPFSVSGSVNATIGPLRETTVSTPSHEHLVASAIPSTTLNGYVAWGTRAYYALNPGRYGNSSFGNVPGAGSISPGTNRTLTFTNYWASSKSSSPQLDNNSGSYLGSIDVTDGTASVSSWDPGTLLTHTHYISQSSFGSSLNVYGYGNVNGGGTATSGMATTTTTSMTFNVAEVALGANDATFTLGTSKQLIPSVSLVPEKKIPLMKRYFRVKYLIKAY